MTRKHTGRRENTSDYVWLKLPLSKTLLEAVQKTAEETGQDPFLLCVELLREGLEKRRGKN